MASKPPTLMLLLVAAVTLSGCSGDTSAVRPNGTDITAHCNGGCASANLFLTVADVQQVIAQAVNEAQARHADATIAVVDRVGNVLGVFRMGDRSMRPTVITARLDANGKPAVAAGLEGIRLPNAMLPANLDDLAAIAKAVTGAYLSSEGNAFSTRVASEIIQGTLGPGEARQPSGPMFGAQFSSLACSDFIQKFNGTGPGIGPQRTPLGLSTDPGGFPLYKGGTVVGGIGVLADGSYTIAKDTEDRTGNLDEIIAMAGTFGFEAPTDRRADRITLYRKFLRFTHTDMSDLARDPASAPAFGTIPAAVGTLTPVTGYTNGPIQRGTAFGQPASGVRPDVEGLYAEQDAFVFVDANNVNRFPPRASPADGASIGLTAPEVQRILSSALAVANHTRSQIRRPPNSPMRATISVVDSQGNILGIARTRDAPLFGSDVSLQKARTAALFSADGAARYLQSLPPARYLRFDDTGPSLAAGVPIGDYVEELRAFLDNRDALNNGAIAFSTRASGSLSQSFPEDIDESVRTGPLSKPAGRRSVFSSGLQLDLSNNAILQHLLFAVSGGTLTADVSPGCAGVDLDLVATPKAVQIQPSSVRVGNGLQMLPGGVPIYRGTTIIGGIGVAGDAPDQDDMVAFLGLDDANEQLARAGGNSGGVPANAAEEMRADAVLRQGTSLSYVRCPLAPFVDNNDAGVCDRK